MSSDPHDDSDPALILLRDALARRAANDLARAMLLVGPRQVQSDDLALLLAQALEEPWHTCHEDIAPTLQLCRDPRTVPALARAARTKYAYLDYDNSHPFARKCIWALADIGTREAHGHLQQLAHEAEPEVAGYAQRRLALWDEERGRKGA